MIMRTTDRADLNEIRIGYYIAGGWYDNAAKKHYDQKMQKVYVPDAEIEDARAQVMAEEAVKWATNKGYRLPIVNVFWRVRPNQLGSLAGINVSTTYNPSDLVIQFNSGPLKGNFDKFLGISAKSTAGTKDITFKNPGLGTVEDSLNIDLYGYVEEAILQSISTFGLSDNANERKREIRADKSIQQETTKIGSEVMSDVRDAVMKKMGSMSQDIVKGYILSDWMFADEVYPPFIKVTGMGVKAPFSARVEDPLKNDKVTKITTGKITLEKEGNTTIRVNANGSTIFRIRAKWESEPLCSPFKFSANP